MKRVEANVPVALCHKGAEQYRKGNYTRAFEYFTKAAEMGYLQAHFRLARLYDEGRGAEKDRGKKIFHLEEASIGGHPSATYDLRGVEWNNGNNEIAVKHWIIRHPSPSPRTISFNQNAYGVIQEGICPSCTPGSNNLIFCYQYHLKKTFVSHENACHFLASPAKTLLTTMTTVSTLTI